MNFRGCFNQRNVVRPTILCSLIFAGLKMLRDAVLDAVIILLVIQTNDWVVGCLYASGCRQIKVVEEWINVWGVHLIYIYIFKYKCKGSVASLQFRFSNLFKAPLLRSWILGLFLYVLALIIVLLFLLLRTGTLRSHSCYFLLVRIICEYYKARGAMNLFQLNESF